MIKGSSEATVWRGVLPLRPNQEEAILRSVCAPCFRGQVACCTLYNGENELGSDPNRGAEKQLLPLRAEPHKASPPTRLLFPTYLGSAALRQGCKLSMWHSGGVMSMLLGDKFPQQRFESTLVSSNTADCLLRKGKGGPHLSLSAGPGFPVSPSSPISPSGCACLRAAGAEGSKAPTAIELGSGILCFESRGCEQVTWTRS